MAALDFNALRAQTMGSSADEEAVTVNTRALIDKVLARYSGEWTTLRELIQNAADATATKVTIKFETIPSATMPLPQDTTPSNLLKHTVQHHTLKRMIVTNNGQIFNENDWTRLKRIAEGNPDETKIGAFGVGFYSTFADCEEPFVSSGNEAMAFFWKSNSLFTRRLKLQPPQASTDTNFVLDYRDTTSHVPPLLSLAQFLASSLTFVGIENIDLWIDGWNILSLRKMVSPSQDVTIPKDIETKTAEGFMKVHKVTKELAQIDGEWMPIIAYKPKQSTVASQSGQDEPAPSLRKFFSRLAGGVQAGPPTAKPVEVELTNLTAKAHATIFLNVDTATIKTFTSQKFNEELERATKKPPPKTTRLAVLTAPFIENDSLAATVRAGDVFATVLPSRSGRIFIGFPTHQTTGLNAHISAPSVIPTVERESIDLNAKYVRTWNQEMLRAAGIVCRIVWTEEMATLRMKIRPAAGARVKLSDVEPYLSEAITIAKNFTFKESTPSPKTGDLIEDAFWRSSKKAYIEVISTCGVLPTYDVRLAPKDLSFIEGVPVLPDRLVDEAKPFVTKLTEFGLVTDVQVSDIKRALESTPLSGKQVIEFMDWIVRQASKCLLEHQTVLGLLNVAIISEEIETGSSKLIMLGNIESFHNPSKIPTEMPVPDTVVPFRYTRSYSKHELESLGWEEYQIVPWIRWLLQESKNRALLRQDQDLTSSAAFAGQILPLLSKQWDAMSQSSRQTIVELFTDETVIPTKFGMRKPREAYFSHVRLFDDLPVITGLSGVKDKILTAFGVRKTVDLSIVFDRLLKSPKDTTSGAPGRHVALVQYLASVRDDIPGPDMQKLRSTAFCPREDKDADSGESSTRYKVSDLFEPRPQLRDLGLPVLAWPGLYRSGSPEGRLLSSLGLRTVPEVNELIAIIAKAGVTGDTVLRDRAIAYFLSNHHAHGYGQFDYAKVTVPFLPLENKPDQLSIPSQCFVDEGALLLGFNILKRDLHAHAPMFGVRRHPPIDKCIQILSTRKIQSYQESRAMFVYFAGRLGEINSSVIPKLQDLNFVPIFPKERDKAIVRTYASPRNVFLGDSETFGDIFNFVDFGNEGNAFLLKCGSKPEPTVVEVAQILVKEPARISSTFRNPEKYLALLRRMAEAVSTLKKNKDLFREMKRAPFLLASKHIPSSQKADGAEDELEGGEDVDAGITEWQLCSAEDAVIVDDFINYNLFKANLLAVPQEEGLEDLYYALGSQMLSSLVEEAARHGPRSADQRPAEKLHKLIMERVPLFLYEQTPDTIKHDTRWLEKNLTVVLVSSITLRRSLKGRNLTHSEKRTAVITQASKDYTLWIVSERPDLYQVSQALIHLLLNRPKLHSPITLEMLLSTDLLSLRNRGFNVSRILRQKAAEARLAESQRQQALEAEQKQIEEERQAWNAVQREAAQRPSKKTSKQQQNMIGAFPDSPETKGSADQSMAPSRPSVAEEPDHFRNAQRMLSNFTRNFGFGPRGQPASGVAPGEQLPIRSVGESASDLPPPYSNHAGPVAGPNTGVTSPANLHHNLLSAIRKTRPHNSSSIFSRGESNTVSETKSYCDERPAHDLAIVAEIKHGIQMFLPHDPAQPIDSSAFLSTNIRGLQSFADLLKWVAEIFHVNVRSLNIFHEVGGKTIAFNRDGSIFCNYLYFQQLHEAGIASDQGLGDAMVYWWVILCHELAHNLVADHSSNHSYYTEGFVVEYFGRCLAKVQEVQRSRPQQHKAIEGGLGGQ